MKKLHSHGGETLVESLVAILVLALLSVFLMTAIGTAAKINSRLDTNANTFRYDTDDGTETAVTVDGKEYTMHYHKVGDYVYYD